MFYQLWMFISPGLYRHEKKYVHIFLPFSIALFLAVHRRADRGDRKLAAARSGLDVARFR